MSINALFFVFSSKLLPLAFAIIGFGLLITIHEFGHFIFCKIFNIHTPTFSIGMGPKLLEHKFGQTNFRLSMIPIGGYVEIAGLSEVGQGEQEFAKHEGENSFTKKPYWQKFFVLSGGVLFNLIFAYLIYSFLFMIGIPKKSASLNISSKINIEIEKKTKLKAQDKIIAINDINISNEPTLFFKIIKKNLIKPLLKSSTSNIKLTILRNSQQLDIILDPSNKDFNNKIIEILEPKSEQLVGQYEKYNIFDAVIKGISTTNEIIKQMVKGIITLIKSKSLQGAGGPILIISQTYQTAQRGLIPLLLFLALISINLSIINILPIGALDGGQLLLVSIEAIIRREIPEIIKNIINMASWVALLSLIVYLSYKDIVLLFNK
ncbi:site-2 protease family protein [Candidatus Dependentiae bacterium]|nr:site-2 protease family protein [Candidatus Dependentiae bacterium]MBU4387573.1 site-2 protease family protein [Candidatus Dependentiae bacterium]MCG2755902.1 site-2 protease family protein [Candidatus Dependentiae bacterium]